MHYVYIVKCADNTLYTGWTTDLPKRIENHNKGLGAKYTRSRLPVKLVYKEEFTTKNAALSREFYIKNKLTREDKLKLIKGSEGF
ncbi:MAG: GIY-YIG nuclease family protein [Clostridiales bacterium]|nr:GIY-YIG nuclease family protein [Clostridiales bacterium]